MNFDLSEEQALFRATVERFAGAGDVEARKRVRAMPGGIDRARWRALAALGLLSLDDLADCAVVAETLGRAIAIEPWLECGYWPLRLIGGVEAGLADGSVLTAVAFAEPRRRFVLEPAAVRATRRGDSWALTGAKTFVLGGAAAELLLVTAVTEEGAGVFAVEAGATGVRPYVIIDGSVAAEATFHAAPATRIDGARLHEAITETRLMAAAEMVGLAARLFDDTLGYVREREQFGQPIGRFQAVQHRLVDCFATLEQMRSTLWRAVLAERGARWPAQVEGAKAFIAEGALRIGHEAIQLHGGMGVTDELAIGHAHKRVMLLSKLLGDPASGLARYAEAA